MGRYLNCLPLGKKGMYSIASAATAPIGILQIDVEGYEVFILQQLMDKILDENNLPLPLVIHFEHEVSRQKKNARQKCELLKDRDNLQATAPERICNL